MEPTELETEAGADRWMAGGAARSTAVGRAETLEIAGHDGHNNYLAVPS